MGIPHRICELKSKSSISILSEIARSQPRAAFSALTHGLLSKWTHFSRVQPNIRHLLVPLNNSLGTVGPVLTLSQVAHHQMTWNVPFLMYQQDLVDWVYAYPHVIQRGNINALS